MMDGRRVGRVLGVTVILEAFCAVCFFLVGRAEFLWGGSFAGLSAVFTVFAGMSLIHSRLLRLVADEKRENIDRPVGTELFADDDSVAGVSSRGLRQFERWVLPSGVAALGVLQCAIAVLSWRSAEALAGPDASLGVVPLPMGITCFIGAFIFFLLSRYAAEVQDETEALLLRPAASRAVLMAVLLFMGGTGAIVAYLGRDAELHLYHFTQLWQLRLLGLASAVLGVESLVNVLVSFYRFRSSGGAIPASPLHDSRLCGSLLNPSGLLAGLADVLEYQFGITVSEEWLTRFLVRNVLPLFSLGIVVLVVASCIAVVSPGEVAVIERWGVPSGNETAPGAHLKFPWPIEKVRRFRPGHVRSISVGMEDAISVQDVVGTDTWDSISPKAPLFFSGGDGARTLSVEAPQSHSRRIPITNLLVAEMTVFYNVRAIPQYYYQHSQPEELLRSVARRVLTERLARTDGLAAVGSGRQALSAMLTAALQEEVNTLQLGIRILSAGLSRVQPPASVVSAFRSVPGEEQRRRRRLLSASAYAIQTVPDAEASAREIVAQAQQRSVSAATTAEAFAELFAARVSDRDAIPRLYEWLLYLERLEKAIGNAPKIVLATECSDQVLSVDLKRDMTPGLLDIGMPANGGE